MDDSIKAIVAGVTDWNINNKDKYDIKKWSMQGVSLHLSQ